MARTKKIVSEVETAAQKAEEKKVSITVKRDVISAKFGNFSAGKDYEVSSDCAEKLKKLGAI